MYSKERPIRRILCNYRILYHVLSLYKNVNVLLFLQQSSSNVCINALKVSVISLILLMEFVEGDDLVWFFTHRRCRASRTRRKTRRKTALASSNQARQNLGNESYQKQFWRFQLKLPLSFPRPGRTMKVAYADDPCSGYKRLHHILLPQRITAAQIC